VGAIVIVSVEPEMVPVAAGASAHAVVRATAAETVAPTMFVLYVPMPPGVPVACEVITVPAVMPAPVTVMPAATRPEVGAMVTESTEPATVPDAPAATTYENVIVPDTAPVDAGENVYVPTPPVPVPSAVIMVGTTRPVPAMFWPTKIAPDVMVTTVSDVAPLDAVPEVTTGNVVHDPATVPDATVCGIATVYVPKPPVPVPNAVITEVGLASVMPILSAPAVNVAAVTVSVVPLTEPVVAGAAAHVAAIIVLARVCGTATVYEPTPPVPVV